MAVNLGAISTTWDHIRYPLALSHQDSTHRPTNLLAFLSFLSSLQARLSPRYRSSSEPGPSPIPSFPDPVTFPATFVTLLLELAVRLCAYILMSSSAQPTTSKQNTKMAAPKTTTAAEAKALAAKMHRRSRSGMSFLGYMIRSARLTCFRMLYVQIAKEEMRGRQTSLQSVQPLGLAMRLQATHVVEQWRAEKAPKGNHQEHHQAHPAVEEDRTGATRDER